MYRLVLLDYADKIYFDIGNLVNLGRCAQLVNLGAAPSLRCFVRFGIGQPPLVRHALLFRGCRTIVRLPTNKVCRLLYIHLVSVGWSRPTDYSHSLYTPPFCTFAFFSHFYGTADVFFVCYPLEIEDVVIITIAI